MRTKFNTSLRTKFRAENKVSQRVPHEVSLKASTGAATLPGSAIRSPRNMLEAQSAQPAMVNLGPLLTLLTMSRHRSRRIALVGRN